MGEAGYHHGNLKQALIEAGLDILKEKGLSGLTLRACAARAGVSHGAPKNHFCSLAVLHAAIVAQGFYMFAGKMTENIPAVQNDGAAYVLAVARGYVAFADENPDLFRLMFSLEREVELYPELEPAARAAYDVLRDMCRWIDFGTAGTAQERLAKETMLWSWIHGYASLRINGQFYKAHREIGRNPELEEILLDLTYRTTPLPPVDEEV